MQSHTELSVLIVSDEPGATRILLAIFRSLDIKKLTVVAAADVPEYDHFHLALIAAAGDVEQALAAADRVRRAQTLPGPRIVVLAISESEALKRFIEWGRIDAVLLKPVTIHALTTQIEGAIERAIRG